MTRAELIRALEDGDVGDRNHFATQLTTALIGDLPERREDDPDKWAEWHRTYTALARALHGSLDAALLLVPEGCAWDVAHLIDEGSPPFASVWRAGEHCGASAKTPALALTAAALRAQEATP